MQYRRLGRTGLKVSPICLGTMQFGWTTDEPGAFEILNEAVELGCNFFDTADVYSNWVKGNPGGVSEQILGNWMKSSPVSRDKLVIATKVRGRMGDGPNDEGLSRQHILNAVDESLRRLQTDYIDLYQVHAPDQDTPLDETLEALNDLVRWGKVRYTGCSNYPAWLLTKSLWISEARNFTRFDSLQPHFSLVNRAEFERELQDLCLDQGIGVIPYSPLGRGFLTGKYRRNSELPHSDRAEGIRSRFMNEQGFAIVDQLEAVGQAKGATVAQTAIAWVLANPAVSSAIIGANSVSQLRDTFQGAEVQLSSEEIDSINKVSAWK